MPSHTKHWRRSARARRLHSRPAAAAGPATVPRTGPIPLRASGWRRLVSPERFAVPRRHGLMSGQGPGVGSSSFMASTNGPTRCSTLVRTARPTTTSSPLVTAVDVVRRYSRQPALWSRTGRVQKILATPTVDQPVQSGSDQAIHQHQLIFQLAPETTEALAVDYVAGMSVAALQAKYDLSKASVRSCSGRRASRCVGRVLRRSSADTPSNCTCRDRASERAPRSWGYRRRRCRTRRARLDCRCGQVAAESIRAGRPPSPALLSLQRARRSPGHRPELRDRVDAGEAGERSLGTDASGA